jgi:metal-responsive CopG/Arc/MetJ family transcriptional regulator
MISLSIPDEMLLLVDRYAKDTLTTRSEVIRSSLLERVRRNQRQESARQKQMMQELNEMFAQMKKANLSDDYIDNLVLSERRKIAPWRTEPSEPLALVSEK